MINFEANHFLERRKRLIEKMGSDAVAIFVAEPEKSRSNDTSFKYRPSSDIVYLTGFEEPETVVVIAPGHELGDFIMFVRKRDPLREQWDGRRYGVEGARERYRADTAFTIDELDQQLPSLIRNRKKLYYTLGGNAEFDLKISNLLNTLRFQRYAPSVAPANLCDARDLVHFQRMVKGKEEIALMKRAGEISGKAHELAMAHTRPGMWEYQLEAVIAHHFRMEGATCPAYESIVGTGDNATILHYIENTAQLKDGEIVLIDAGCEYDYYAGDISRSWPVNGRFTPEQKDAYEIVLDCEIRCIDRIRKGVKYNDVKREAVQILTEGMVELGVLDKHTSVDSLIESGAYRPYYPHSIGHYLGIDVHDVGSYYNDDGSDRELVPGMVVTIEPGLYFPKGDETIPAGLRGVGIRIEDDIVCTEGEPVILSENCIKSVKEIEEMVGSAYH